MDGWIKLHRKLLDWQWYDDTNIVRVFLHLLLKANFDTKGWHDISIERGQLVTSIKNLAAETHLSVMQIRRALTQLQKTKEITIETTNKYTMITICNYAKYQCFDSCEQQTNNNQITNEQQTNNNQTTTTKEINNIRIKEDNKDCIIYTAAENFESAETENQNIDNSTKRKKEPKKKYGEYQNVRLTNDEATKLHEKFGDDAVQIVNYFDEQIEMKGYKYKSHYLAILNWGAKAYYQQLNKSNYGTNDYNNPASPDYVTTERIVAAGREWAKHFS